MVSQVLGGDLVIKESLASLNGRPNTLSGGMPNSLLFWWAAQEGDAQWALVGSSGL